MSVTATVALFGLVKVLFKQRADWNPAAWLIFSMGWLAQIPSAYGSLTGGKVRSQDDSGNPITVLSGRTVELTHICNYLELAIPLVIILVQVSKRPRVNVVPALAFLLCAFAAIASGLNDFPLFGKSVWVMFVALIALALVPTGRGACLGAATFAVSLAAVSGLVTLASYPLATSVCVGLYKCGPLGVFYFGVVDNENGLALILAAGLVFVWLGVRSFLWRNVLFLYVLGMIWVSGARTSLLAGVILLAAILIIGRGAQVDSRRSKPYPIPRLLGAFIALATVTVVSAVLPFVTNDPSAYTARGAVWLAARGHLAGHYATGLGQPAWAALVNDSVIGNYAGYSTHNQWLDVLWIAGWAGLAIFIVMLLVMLGQDFIVATLILLPMIVLGVTERAWGISHFDDFTYAYLAALVAIPAAVKARPQRISNNKYMSSVHRELAALREIVQPELATVGAPGDQHAGN